MSSETVTRTTTAAITDGVKVSFGNRLGHLAGELLEAATAGFAAWSFTAGWHYWMDKRRLHHAQEIAQTTGAPVEAKQAAEVIGRFGDAKDALLELDANNYVAWMEFEAWLMANERHSYEDMLLRARHWDIPRLTAALNAVANRGRGNYPAMRQELRSRELTQHCKESDYLGAKAHAAETAAERKFREMHRWLEIELPQLTRKHKSTGYGRFVEMITR